ncbi:MAG: YHS domain protein, partial [Bacteroidetes bacterium]|nr:YHS domain protein [Bacteroidota bacterium]
MKDLMLAAALFASISACAQDAAFRQKNFNLSGGVGINGYDPVAYFALNKAIKGTKDLAAAFEGVTYYFSSVADKEEFGKHPEKYEPQYGGWCAYAMGKDGSKVEVDPETFKIIDGKLFLFYNRFFNNTLKSWDKDEEGLHHRADA